MFRVFLFSTLLLAIVFSIAMASQDKTYDIVIRNGMIYDGSGSAPYKGDVAIQGQKIAAVGNGTGMKAQVEVDAQGLAVAPGFINMLSWAVDTLIEDGKSQSDIRQGVTLEVFGEGASMGPLNDTMKKEMEEDQGDIKYKIEWTTLAEYLDYLVKRGISTNVASFVGATTVRIYVLGYEDRAPNAEELIKMQELVRQAMKEGALGVGSSLIYAPAFYSKTDELIALCKVASEYGGMYISHIRSEGNQVMQALDELIQIAREANIPAEVYHLKISGKSNWSKLPEMIQKIEAAQKEGLKITADMYLYPAGATGLDASMPPWVQEGGYDQWAERLKDPAIRTKVIKEMSEPADTWENLYNLAGSPDNVLLIGFKNDALKPLTGKTLAQVAKMRGKSPEETAIELVIEDGSRVSTAYFLMSEDNIKKEVALSWVSFGSDEGSYASEGVFLKSNAHPRAYGNFSRLLGKYVREEQIISLQEAIQRMTSFPAKNMKIEGRGTLAPGYYADVVVFDPAKIIDHATFEKPHQYATGMVHVFVNGTQVLKNGEHTGAKPGQVVRGPGYRK